LPIRAVETLITPGSSSGEHARRKYKVFLVLVTQRPDKLDPFIISECDNIAVMKLGSESVGKEVAQVLSVNDTDPKFHRLEKGRFKLFGRWARTQGVLGYTAERRSREGGRDGSDAWAQSPSDSSGD